MIAPTMGGVPPACGCCVGGLERLAVPRLLAAAVLPARCRQPARQRLALHDGLAAVPVVTVRSAGQEQVLPRCSLDASCSGLLAKGNSSNSHSGGYSLACLLSLSTV